MEFHLSLLCTWALLLSASCEELTTELNPRGPRPVAQGFKSDKCAPEKHWPICLDEDWGKKCPSGCRISGIINEADHTIHKKIKEIEELLKDRTNLHRSADVESRNTYSFLRERLVSSVGDDNRYATLAEQLRQRIVDLKIKIDKQIKVLEDIKTQIKSQFIEVQRLEVDIDIKLRGCKGSCGSHGDFSVDQESFNTLQKQLDHLDSLPVRIVETDSSLKVLKIRPLKNEDVSSIYKSGAIDAERTAQKKILFSDVGQLRLSLEAEGSTEETAATVSKVSTRTDQFAPGSTTHINTETLSCTKTVRKITTHTKDGIQERYETVHTGPGCDAFGKLGISEADLVSAAKDGKELSADGFKVKVTSGDSHSITTLSQGKGELGGFEGDFFRVPGSSHHDSKISSSYTSSSSSSKSFITDGSKGTLSDTKSITSGSSKPDFSDDLGAFFRTEVEDDHPDLHARSVRPRGARKADFIGGGTTE